MDFLDLKDIECHLNPRLQGEEKLGGAVGEVSEGGSRSRAGRGGANRQGSRGLGGG